MPSATVSKINQKIKSLPADLLQEVDQYIDFLKYRNDQSDWSKSIAENQFLLIEKGKKDIEEGRIYTHKEAKQKIADYIKSKTQ
ncbi:DUF2281 domain-containing protein [Flavobacterium sp. ZT3R18]|uniref:DUF2281 domain-containing protein n=1 Tax=Flavobacterium sp. ZT3R18 TaxID=2594429 RepID=UPI001179A9F7|nr:DUF2281 domain-containing protein [Flavobacterium sp. ZT3R18]TRX38104.1 DUF2281 domain-containing protein [Flavobacterium sp. ZT3R18]